MLPTYILTSFNNGNVKKREIVNMINSHSQKKALLLIQSGVSSVVRKNNFGGLLSYVAFLSPINTNMYTDYRNPLIIDVNTERMKTIKIL